MPVNRADWAVIVLTGAALIPFGFFKMDGGARYGGVFSVLATAAAVIAANHAIARAPKLLVTYRNPSVRGEPKVWKGGKPPCRLHVWLTNIGHAPAEAIEVRFDSVGSVDILNESGNSNPDVDIAFHPPRFTSAGRVLNPRDEWCIAMLAWYGKGEPRDGPAHWTATAKGMKRQAGMVKIVRIDPPPGSP